MAGILSSIKRRIRAARTERLGSRAVRSRARSDAVFIGITGSSGKSTATALLAHILRARGEVRMQLKFNDRRAVYKTIARSGSDRGFVVAEAGAGSSGSIKVMAEALRPDVAIVTMVALEHHASFRTAEVIAAEKEWLVANVAPGGFAMLNADDPLVMNMARRTSERVVTFGRSGGADYRATDIVVAFPDRLRFTVVWRDGSLDLGTRFVGAHFWVSTLAAVTAALELGTPPEIVAERVASFEPLLERCGVLSVPNGPQFILDTAKAPWHSVRLAFDIMKAARAPRKRIVLGYISDFAGNSRPKYRDAYRMARESADQVIFVGGNSHRSRASPGDVESGRFIAFKEPREVTEFIRATAVPGELILLKGSANLHLERVALAWIEDVRCWPADCGQKSGCIDCGRYRDPFDWHQGRKRRGRLRRALKKLSPALDRDDVGSNRSNIMNVIDS